MNDATRPSARIPGAQQDQGSAPAKPRQIDRKQGSAKSHWPKWPVVGLFIGAVLFVLIAASGIVFFLIGRPPTPTYVTQPVTRGSIVRVVTASGTVNPIITVQVGTYVSGVILARYCDYNTKVKKGQLCAKIDPRPFQVIVDQDIAIVAVARAQLEKDKANLLYTKSALDRYEKLIATKAVSQDVYDLAKSQYAQAQAQIGYDYAAIQRDEAILAAAKVNLDYTNIISPVDGTVVSRSVEMGQTVAASFQTPTLFLIATDLTALEVDTNVAEGDIGQLHVGARAMFTVESYPNKPFAGTVTEVRQSPQTVQNVVTYNAVVSADNKAGLLMPGMTATVRFEADRRDNVLRVPNQALRYVPGGFAGQPGAPTSADNPVPSAGGSQIFVLRDGQIARIAIVTGLDDDTYTEVVKGDLKEGDRVIVGETAPARGARSATERILRF